MGLIESAGTMMLNLAGSMMKIGYSGWEGCIEITNQILVQNPQNGDGWNVVGPSSGIYTLMSTIGASLLVLYFVLGWLKESIDIRNNFTLENMFRFFVRFAIAATIVSSAASLATGMIDCSVAMVSQVAENNAQNMEEVGDVFSSVKLALEDEGDEDGWMIVICGMICLLLSIFGSVIVIINGVKIIITVMQRIFKLLIAVPFAPVSLAGFAGGHEFSQMGIAWVKTFIGYALEAVVIAVALQISLVLMGNLSIVSSLSSDNPDTIYYITFATLSVVDACLPMIAANACTSGAENIVRHVMGVG